MALSAIEIAQKQRHLHLLNRVKNNKPLTRRELKELAELEKMAQKEQRTVKSKKNAAAGKKKRRRSSGHIKNKDKRRRDWQAPKKGDRELAALAKELKDVAAFDKKIGEHFDLEEHPRIKTALREAVSQQIEDIIKRKFRGKKYKDFRRVTFKQLEELTGRTRRTIYDWLGKGLKRESDGSFFLPTFITWFEQYTVEKLPAKAVAAANPYQKLRTEHLKYTLAEQKRELLRRDEVMAGYVARHQNLVTSFRHKAEDLLMEIQGLPESKKQEILNKFFDDVLTQQCSVPEELHLPEEIAELFAELLKKLKGE